MTTFVKAKSKIEAAIKEVLAEESKEFPIDITVDHMDASISIGSGARKSILLDYFKCSDDAERKLKINWSCVGSVKTSDKYLRVLAKILANADVLEAKICCGEIGALLDSLD